jgi:class 3 adenylate cyclase
LPPLSQRSAYANLLLAVTEARQAMVGLNEKNSETGRAPLNYGIGVHVGDVMYGNIGSRTRLDFTVIGPAVNMASRLETFTKQLGRTVLLSPRVHRLRRKRFRSRTRRRISGARLQRPNRAVCCRGFGQQAKLHPVGRKGEIQGIVDAILFLENAPFVTGEMLRVDGGQSAGH